MVSSNIQMQGAKKGNLYIYIYIRMYVYVYICILKYEKELCIFNVQIVLTITNSYDCNKINDDRFLC